MPAAQGAGSRGGQTQVQRSTPSTTTTAPPPLQAVLRLRGAATDVERGDGEGSERRRIQWAEDVIDNEGMGKKKSKVCCIYHAPKAIDESSDESSSGSDSDSDSGDDGAARPPRRRPGHDHNHDHDHGPGHDHSHDHGKGKGRGRERSPNAYEKVPKPKAGGTKQR